MHLLTDNDYLVHEKAYIDHWASRTEGNIQDYNAEMLKPCQCST